MELAASTWTDAEAASPEVVVVPIGSTEQHGPHAPLSTDTITAEAVAEAGVEAYSADVVVTPTLPVSASVEHRHFAGTLWLRPDTLRAYVRDVVDSLASHGWEQIVLVNGHGGNSAPLNEVASELSRDREVFVAVFTWFEAVGDDIPPMGHAGPRETAMLRRHAPELVREERVEEASAGASEQWGDWTSGVNLAYDSEEFAPNGVVGDPIAGDADLGEELTARAGAALADLLATVADR